MLCLKALAEDIWKSYETERFQFENRGETLGMEPQSLCLLGWETKYPSHPTVATPPCTHMESSSPPILVQSVSILVSLSSRCAHSLTRGTPQCRSATKLDFLNQKRSLTSLPKSHFQTSRDGIQFSNFHAMVIPAPSRGRFFLLKMEFFAQSPLHTEFFVTAITLVEEEYLPNIANEFYD